MKYSHLLLSSLASCALIAPQFGLANSFGVYDARTLAMGGTAVAVGTVNDGHFYNPALTAFHIGSEEKTRDGRSSLHVVANLLVDGVESAADTITESLDGKLGDIIDRYNLAESPYQDASDGFDLANELASAMHIVDDLAVGADGYVGFSISEPSDRKGGVFTIGTRVIASGIADIADSDYELVNDYVETFDFFLSQGERGDPHPELIDADGRLVDPSYAVRSTAVGTAVAISEIAMSFAKIYTIANQELSFGITPKIVHLNVYDTHWYINNGNLSHLESDIEKTYFNADVGVALNLGDHFRFGFAVKDLARKTVTSEFGNEMSFGRYKRMGIAYFDPRFTLGVDIDLGVTPDILLDRNRKDVSGGIEIKFANYYAARFGYRRDLQGVLKDNISAGLAWHYKYIAIEAAYTTNTESQGGALEISYVH